MAISAIHFGPGDTTMPMWLSITNVEGHFDPCALFEESLSVRRQVAGRQVAGRHVAGRHVAGRHVAGRH
eukprot:4813103-Pleurochrysis_carterae.AAC.1